MAAPISGSVLFWVIIAIAGWVAKRAGNREKQRPQSPAPPPNVGTARAAAMERARQQRFEFERRLAARRVAVVQPEPTPQSWRLPKGHEPLALGREASAPQLPPVEPDLEPQPPAAAPAAAPVRKIALPMTAPALLEKSALAPVADLAGLRSPVALRQAIILKEILSPPVSLRRR